MIELTYASVTRHDFDPIFGLPNRLPVGFEYSGMGHYCQFDASRLLACSMRTINELVQGNRSLQPTHEIPGRPGRYYDFMEFYRTCVVIGISVGFPVWVHPYACAYLDGREHSYQSFLDDVRSGVIPGPTVEVEGFYCRFYDLADWVDYLKG